MKSKIVYEERYKSGLSTPQRHTRGKPLLGLLSIITAMQLTRSSHRHAPPLIHLILHPDTDTLNQPYRTLRSHPL